MNLYAIETDNGERYEDHDHASFIVLANNPEEAKALVPTAKSYHDPSQKAYGCEFPVCSTREIAKRVKFVRMPKKPTVIY